MSIGKFWCFLGWHKWRVLNRTFEECSRCPTMRRRESFTYDKDSKR